MTLTAPLSVEPIELMSALREFSLAHEYGWSIVFEPAQGNCPATAWLEWNVTRDRMLELLELDNACLSYLEDDTWVAWCDSPEPSSGHYTEPCYDVRYLLIVA